MLRVAQTLAGICKVAGLGSHETAPGRTMVGALRRWLRGVPMALPSVVNGEEPLRYGPMDCDGEQ